MDIRIISGTSHKLRSFWAGPYQVSRLIAPALAEIKPVYYPGEEKLVSLDVLKLYSGKDVIRQDPEDVDPDRWLDAGELIDLPQYLGEYKIQSDSILNIGMKFRRKKANGKRQISGREFCRWCFVVEV